MKPKLQYCSSGPFVAELQSKLNALMPEAQPPLKIDGKYGDRTVARVIRFQRSRGLVPDGVVGQRTWAAIDGLPSPEPPPHNPPTLPPLHLKGTKVYRGMPLACSWGKHRSVLMLHTNGPATVGDCVSCVNIPTFGECKSPENPAQPWFEPLHYEDPLMKDVSFTYKPPTGVKLWCKPEIITTWEGLFTRPGISHSAEIDKSARCRCKFGGTIWFVGSQA